MLLSVRLFLEGHVSQGFTGADVLQTLVCQFVVPDVEILQMLHAPDVLQAASFEAVSIEDELLGLREGVAEHLDARVAELILTQDEFLDLPEPAQGQQIFIGQALLRQVDFENGFGHTVVSLTLTIVGAGDASGSCSLASSSLMVASS